MKLSDQRLTKEGVIAIKAQEHRSQEQNQEEALQRLQDLIKSAIAILSISTHLSLDLAIETIILS